MELIYTWAELKAIIDRIDTIAVTTDAIIDSREYDTRREEYIALWDERHALEEKRDAMEKQLIPEVGVPCTVRYYSDSSGGYIKKVLSPKKILVQQDGVYSGRKIFTHRRNGFWIEEGSTSKDPSTICHLGYKHNYYDRSF